MPFSPLYQPRETRKLSDSLAFEEKASNDIWALKTGVQWDDDIASLSSILDQPDPLQQQQAGQSGAPAPFEMPAPLPVVVSERPDAARIAQQQQRQAPPAASGTPAAMPTAPATVDATITAGPRPGQSLQPGESVGTVSMGAKGQVDNSSRESFIRTAYPYALEAADGDPKLANQLLATAISENGNVGSGRDLGASMGFNVGGIQGIEGPAGSFTADDAGRPRQFAAYNNLSEGFRAVRDLVSGGRYAQAAANYRQTGDVDRYWREVNEAGYAEDGGWHANVGNIRTTQVEPLTRGQQQPARTPVQAEQTPQAQRQSGSTGFDVNDVAQRYGGGSYVFGGGRDEQGLGIPGTRDTDCSGFVSAVMRERGVALPAHTDAAYSALQSAGAQQVSQETAQPGDVVFYMGAGYGGNVSYHMGIYAGNGQVLDSSSNGGQGVRLRPITHAGGPSDIVILRDPRVNGPADPRQASAPPPLQPTGIAESPMGERMVAMNAGEGVSPASPAAPPPAAPGDVPPATGGGSEQAMWSPDAPADGPAAFQASAGRSGGQGVMYRGPLGAAPQEVGNEQPEPTVADPTISDPSYTAPAAGVSYGPPLSEAGPEQPQYVPTLAPAGTPPTTGGDWQPVETVPAPSQTPYGPPLSEAGPAAAPESPLKPVWDEVGNIIGYVQAGASNLIERVTNPKPVEGKTDADRRIIESVRSVGQPLTSAVNETVAASEQALGVPEGTMLQAAQDASGVMGPDGPVRTFGSAVRAAAPVVQEAASAAGRGVRSLAEEGARQLMELTPMPRVIGEGGGAARRPAQMTVEVLQDRVARVRELVQDAQARGDRALVEQGNEVMAQLQSDLADAVNARRTLEPRITSDVGRRIETTMPTEARAERTLTQDAMTGASGQPARPDELSGPVSIPPNMNGRMNAALPFDPAGAALGAGAGAATEGEDGEHADPWRTGMGMAAGAVVGRMRRQPGKTFAFGTKAGERLEFNVRVVPLRSLITSHDDALRINRAFPSELQPRVRERAASKVQIDKIVETFDPEQVLVDSHRVDSGPMIVGPDMVVESGNGRSIALRRLAQENPEAYADYVQALRDELPSYGLADDALAGIDQPVLVRERVTDVDRATFAADANVGVQARMAPVEQAAQDAGRISDDAVARIIVGEDQTIDEALMSAENGGFRRAFMATIPENEWGELLTGDGNLNPRGLARVKDALLAKTYTGASGARLTTAFVDSLDSGIKNVQHGIMGSLPQVARVESRIAAGEIDPSLSIAADMATAADVYSRLRRRKTLLRDYIAQSGMFEGRETTPFQDKILAYLDANARSPKRIRAMLDEYARAVDGMAGAEQVDMFGLPIPQATKDEVLDDVLRRLGADAGADQGADLGRVGAGSNVVEGADAAAATVPEQSSIVAAGGSDGAATATAPGPRLTPEEQLARFQQQAVPSSTPEAPAPLRPARLGPAQDVPRGGPEGTLAVQGAPQPMPRPGPIEPLAPRTGGPEGRLEVEGGPQSVGARPGAPMDAPRTGGPEGTLALEGAPDPLRDRAVPPSADARTNVPSEPIGKALPGLIEMLTERTRAPRIKVESKPNEPTLPGLADSPNVWRRVAEALAPWGNRINVIRYAGMLSDTATQAMNAGGGVMLQGVDLAAKPIAATLDAARSAVTGKPREVFFSEIPAQVAGMRAGASVGLQNAWSIIKTGARESDADKLGHTTSGFGTDIEGVAPAGSKAAGVIDFAFEGPLRALAAADAVFRSMATGGHLMAEAEAAARKLAGGKSVTPEMIREAAKDPALLERVKDLAARSVLQEDRALTAWYARAVRGAPAPLRAAASVEIPFVKTPYNIIAQGMGMTPAGLATTIYDVSQGKAARQVEHQLARVALGTAIMSGAAADYAAGNLTGPRPTDQAEASTLPPGWQPWSRKVRNPFTGETHYVPLGLAGPLAVPAVTVILAAEAHKKGKTALSPEWAGQVALGIGRYAEQSTFFEGIANISKLFDERTGETNIARNVEQIAAQFSPHIIGGGGVGKEIQRIMGMPMRDPEGALEALLATHPMTAGRVQPRQDVLGRPVVQGGGAASALVRAPVERDVAVIRAFRKAGEGLPTPPKQIRDVQADRSVLLAPSQQKRWQRAFGAALREGWDNEGNPTDAKTLQTIESRARTVANETVLGQR